MKFTNFILFVFHEIFSGQFEENCQFGENDHFQKSWWETDKMKLFNFIFKILESKRKMQKN